MFCLKFKCSFLVLVFKVNVRIKELKGPTILPQNHHPQSLVVLLHGYGDSGQGLIDLARFWSPMLPQTGFVALNAPEAWDMGPIGYQWFSLKADSPQTYENKTDADFYKKGVDQALPSLTTTLSSLLTSYKLPPEKLAVVGFSQGTMMALSLVGRFHVKSILGYSGAFIESSLPANVTEKPEVLLIHGDQDDVVPIDASRRAKEYLSSKTVPIDLHVEKGLGHSISEAGLDLGEAFLRKNLGY